MYGDYKKIFYYQWRLMSAKFMVLMFSVALLMMQVDSSAAALQVLGFQQWQQPSAQQITAQYKLLTENYQNSQKTPQQSQKYQKIKQAYQQLQSNNYGSQQQQQRKPSNTHNIYQGASNKRQTFNHRNQEYHFNSFNVDDLLNNFDFEMYMGDRHDRQGKIQVDFLGFIQQNPEIFIALFLIFFGIVNLCTCFCCCCCRCCRKSDKKQAIKNKDKTQISGIKSQLVYKRKPINTFGQRQKIF